MSVAQLGKYQLVAEIARGGMGIVYLAVTRGPAGFHKLLVVKQLKPELAEDALFVEMFLEEARLAARLNHPNIVQTYEVGSDDGRHFMVMDYLEGVTLARLLKKRSPELTLAMRIRVACEILQGLHYAHTLADFDGRPLGIVHRDATPQNVFVTYDGQIKLVDFGIAKVSDSSIETATGVMKGKPAYMAPEQVSGSADARADVFAIGVMLWEAVANRRMWERRTDVEIVAATIRGEVPSLREAAMAAPAGLVRIVDRALAVSPDERYASAVDLAADLEGFLATLGPHVGARDVGRLAGELYAVERAAEKAQIERYLSGASPSAELSRLPSLYPPSNNGSFGELSADGDLRAGTTRMESSVTPGLRRRLENASGAPLDPAPSGPRRGVVLATIGATFALIAVALGVLAVSSRSHAPAVVQAKASERRSVPETPATHDVTVRAFPDGATLTIDGAEVSNPVKRTCVHGNGFSVHASSPGSASSDRRISCERDESIEIALTAQPPPTPAPVATRVVVQYVTPPSRPAAPARPVAAPRVDNAPPPRSSDVSPAGGTKPNRPIDTSSPYGQ